MIGPGGEPPLPEETTEPNSVPELCRLKPKISMTCPYNGGQRRPWKHWYFDFEDGLCKKTKGAILNENQFETKEECKQTCQSQLSDDEIWEICQLKPVEGPCKARNTRWYFDPTFGECKNFRKANRLNSVTP